jgi:hypothetical protein
VEARGLDGAAQAGFREERADRRVAQALEPVLERAGRGVGGGDAVGQDQEAAGPQDAAELGQREVGLPQVVEHEEAARDAERAVGEGQCAGVGPGPSGAEVHAEAPAEAEGEAARAAAHVEERLPGAGPAELRRARRQVHLPILRRRGIIRK